MVDVLGKMRIYYIVSFHRKKKTIDYRSYVIEYKFNQKLKKKIKYSVGFE